MESGLIKFSSSGQWLQSCDHEYKIFTQYCYTYHHYYTPYYIHTYKYKLVQLTFHNTLWTVCLDKCTQMDIYKMYWYVILYCQYWNILYVRSYVNKSLIATAHFSFNVLCNLQWRKHNMSLMACDNNYIGANLPVYKHQCNCHQNYWLCIPTRTCIISHTYKQAVRHIHAYIQAVCHIHTQYNLVYKNIILHVHVNNNKYLKEIPQFCSLCIYMSMSL